MIILSETLACPIGPIPNLIRNFLQHEPLLHNLLQSADILISILPIISIQFQCTHPYTCCIVIQYFGLVIISYAIYTVYIVCIVSIIGCVGCVVRDGCVVRAVSLYGVLELLFLDAEFGQFEDDNRLILFLLFLLFLLLRLLWLLWLFGMVLGVWVINVIFLWVSVLASKLNSFGLKLSWTSCLRMY